MTVEEMHRIFTSLPELETERLYMRRLLPSDTLDMFEYASLPSVTEYLLWCEHPNVQYTREYLEYLESRYAVGDFYDWALVLKENGKMIGTCGFTSIDLVNNTAEIGYVINPAYHGIGIAPEAARRVLSFGFSVLELSRISAVCMKENEKSLRVMKKIGMSYEGVLRSAVYAKGKHRDVCLCAITSEDFERLS